MRAWFTADGTVQDRAGANHGTLLNGATFVPGRVGQAFGFDGVDDRFEVPDHPSLTPAQVTVEGWVRIDAFEVAPGAGAPELTIVTRADIVNSTLGGYQLLVDVSTGDPGSNQFMFMIVSGTGPLDVARSTTRIVLDRWYHLAGTFDGQAVRLYVDGVLEGETPLSTPITYGAHPLVLGASGDPLDPRAIRGALDEVTIHGRALTDEEVRVIHAAGESGKCRALDFFPLALPGADLGVPYLADVFVEPALARYAFRLASGTLPAGIDFLGSDTPTTQFATLSGTPTEAGAFDFTVEARNAEEAVSKAYTLNVFACPVPAQQLVAWYRAEGTASDRAGGNHGLLQSGVTFAPGRVGEAFSLDGLQVFSAVFVANVPAINPADALTLAAWVFPTATSGGPADPVGAILAKGGQGPPGVVTQYAIGRRNGVACGSGPGIPTGNLAFVLGGREVLLNDVPVWLSNLPDDCSGWVDAHAQLPLETWSHVALTFDGALVRTYVNGALTREVVSTDALPVSAGQLVIGARGASGHWTGLIDEVMIFAQALGPAEVPALIESLDVETCAGPPNRAPRLTVPGRQTNAVLDTVSLPLRATDPDLDTLTWGATGLPPGLAISPTTGVIDGTLLSSAGGEHTVVVFVSDGMAESRGSFGWTVLGSRTVSIGDASVNRSATATTTATFTVTLLPALTTGPASVQFATADGTALAGVDYVARSGPVTFAPGQSVVTISVTVLAGPGPAPDRTFFVSLSGPTGAQLGRDRGTGTIVGGQASGPVTIVVVETVGVVDSPNVVGPAAIAVSELVGVTEVPTAVPPAVLNIAELAGVFDTPAAVPPVALSVAELVGVTEVPAAVPPVALSVAELVGVTEVPVAVPPVIVSLAEPVAIGAVPGAVPPAVVSIAEPVAIGDMPGAVPPAVVSIAEPVAIGDMPGAVPPAVVSITEPVAIGDAPSAGPPNQTPPADAGPGSTVLLDGSGSSDPDPANDTPTVTMTSNAAPSVARTSRRIP